jgi:16S rRNA (guanine1516-N2)-methyltransferase
MVTTPYKPTPSLIRQAEQTAHRLQAVYVPRGSSSIAKLRSRCQAEALVVVGMKGLEWHNEDGTVFFFHPGMSLVRAKRLAGGQKDAMLQASGFQPGDTVLDCTAGLCSDAIVFSFAGGAASRVTALESEFPLYFIVSNGLRRYASDWPAFEEAMQRIEVRHSRHTEYLRAMPAKSVDIVYFDPMFRSPVHASSGLSPLRSLANDEALAKEAVEEAKRVARKCVVLKERTGAEEWERYGFTVVSKPNAPVAYGVITI